MEREKESWGKRKKGGRRKRQAGKERRRKSESVVPAQTKPRRRDGECSPCLMQTKGLDMLIIHVGMELDLHKTLCHFLVAQLQDIEPNVSRKH
jgi:hypothetical protein